MILLQGAVGITIIFVFGIITIMFIGCVIFTAYYSYKKYKAQGSLTWSQGFESFEKAAGLSFLLVIIYIIILFILLKDVVVD